MILDAASEGTHVILGMLVVGLIFLVVIGLGELSNWLGHRRAARKRARPQAY
jgi:ABC-type antimicrobial peptide transport system permease subunit